MALSLLSQLALVVVVKLRFLEIWVLRNSALGLSEGSLVLGLLLTQERCLIIYLAICALLVYLAKLLSRLKLDSNLLSAFHGDLVSVVANSRLSVDFQLRLDSVFKRVETH